MNRFIQLITIISLLYNTTQAQGGLASGPAQDPNTSLKAGIEITNGQLMVSDELKRIWDDSLYRESIYPSVYEFETAVEYLETGNTLLGIWYLLNAYEKDPKFTLKLISMLATSDIQADVFKNAFNTYIFFDPDLMKVQNGIPVLMSPEKLKQKATNTNALIRYFTWVQTQLDLVQASDEESRD